VSRWVRRPDPGPGGRRGAKGHSGAAAVGRRQNGSSSQTFRELREKTGTSKRKWSFALTVPGSLNCRRRPLRRQRRGVGVNAAQGASTGPPPKAWVGRTLSVVASHKRRKKRACREGGGRRRRRRVVLAPPWAGTDPPSGWALWLSLLVRVACAWRTPVRLGRTGAGERPQATAESALAIRPVPRHVAPETDPTLPSTEQPFFSRQANIMNFFVH
jgi:hypothetical protein